MAKLKKRKLRWNASESQQVVGYRIYWAEAGEVGYDSPFADLGNVTEVVLPDEVEGFSPKGDPVEFGVAAVDELGNESDLVILKAPYQFRIPSAPGDLRIEPLNEFHTKGEEPEVEKPNDSKFLIAKGGDSMTESGASSSPIDAKDETKQYFAKLYENPEI
ncbi:MAG: hypothetical protein LJE94_05475 [Deltaproteobacteria bacterium]|nr:hypothetical protein [Deltaproteobacteria bacterium]